MGKALNLCNYDHDMLRKRGATYCENCSEELTRRHEMILNETERKEFEIVVRPLIKWLNDNCHPHVSVIADCSHAELLEGVNSFVTEDYLRD